MKKNLLLSAALLCMGIASNAAVHNIYVANLTDWGSDVALYSWGDSEIFGEWPGATPSSTVTLSGVKYDVFTFEGHDGETAHPIFNNNNNGQQVDLNEIVLDQENYYFATNGVDVKQYSDPANPDTDFAPVESFVYLLDKTGWDSLYLYAWATGSGDVFGGWPGTKAEETEVIEGETYKKIAYPGDGSTQYNFIFNNGGDVQFDGPTVPSGTTIYLEVTADSYKVLPTPGKQTYNIYVNIQGSWEAVYLYAYYDNAPSLFGGWPGINVTAQPEEKIDGVTYHVISGVEATDDAQSFIFNNNDKEQYDVDGTFPINQDIYLTMTDSGVVSVVSLLGGDDAVEEYYTLDGLRVDNPQHGIYICRKGAQVSKIVK
ncbi:MAG: starch-binding protein [Bacteroides sp.]|nr:starch-binding protein [Bacteroides sp.]